MMPRSSVSSVKKTASTTEAPIWKAYLAIRTGNASGALNAGNAVNYTRRGSNSDNVRGRKRTKPSATRGGAGTAIWLMLATPLTTTRRSGEEDGAAVLKSIRHYWEQLSVNERQQILFLDEPELVKQLYKLNLSLLCVGLMQRHLKTSNRTATDASTAKAKTAATVTSKNVPVAPATPVIQERTAAGTTTTPSTRAATDTSSEKTYELLEAMEFMDIGTGILTVKTELAEDTDRLFTLVGDVLVGFLTSIHVLTEANFNKLFVAESETINAWENYQRLIAMLVEQLILRSYVNHLEKEAAQQMEQLLLEVSLEDKVASTATSTSTPHNIKTNKKKKKKKSTARAVSDAQQSDISRLATESKSDCSHMDSGASTQQQSEEVAEEEPAPEPMPQIISITIDSDCHRISSTGSVDTVALDVDEVMPTEVENLSKRSSGLNPHALVFQPQEHVTTGHSVDERSPLGGKRKFDEYVVSVPWEDVASDDGSTFDSRSVEGDISDAEDDKGDNRRWRKQRRREQDAELEWQLQQVYASASSLFGWDFSRQCELPDPGANLPWSESTLWRTAPKEVVRYFSPGNGDSYSRFHAPQLLPRSGPPPSRYYFHPGPPFGPQLLPPPGLEPHGSFGFPAPEFPMVVASPDFSNAQYHPSRDENQVDV
ncbi:hypothetical protein PRIC1_013126 [Phytophthora ramorum]